jgi:glutathione synthase/RimK-type ligase-like ATP-grasp enzyme
LSEGKIAKMNNKIMLLLDSMGKYPQKLHETESLNIDTLTEYLNSNGYQVSTMVYHDFLTNISKIDCSQYIFIYASSQYEEYKEYIEDILLYIVKVGGRIIPDFQMFRSHENKSFQELYKIEKKIATPSFNIVGTFEEGAQVLSKVNFPIIGKTISGFGSKGVAQINNMEEGKKFLKKNMKSGIQLSSDGLRVLGRRLKYRNQYPQKRGKLVFQEKINGVDHDWKILVFGDLCFCLKRSVRKNDFRASGSGIFDFEAVPTDSILNFAYDTKNKLDTPWVSLDIIVKGDNCYLIEYQALHFGLSTLINNKYYYKYEESNKMWNKYSKDKECEYYFAQALDNYITK